MSPLSVCVEVWDLAGSGSVILRQGPRWDEILSCRCVYTCLRNKLMIILPRGHSAQQDTEYTLSVTAQVQVRTGKV